MRIACQRYLPLLCTDKLTTDEDKEYYDCPHAPNDRDSMGGRFPEDSLKVVDIEEVVVIATRKRTVNCELPVATTLLSQKICKNQVHLQKNLTGIVQPVHPGLWF